MKPRSPCFFRSCYSALRALFRPKAKPLAADGGFLGRLWRRAARGAMLTAGALGWVLAWPRRLFAALGAAFARQSARTSKAVQRRLPVSFQRSILVRLWQRGGVQSAKGASLLAKALGGKRPGFQSLYALVASLVVVFGLVWLFVPQYLEPVLSLVSTAQAPTPQWLNDAQDQGEVEYNPPLAEGEFSIEGYLDDERPEYEDYGGEYGDGYGYDGQDDDYYVDAVLIPPVTAKGKIRIRFSQEIGNSGSTGKLADLAKTGDSGLRAIFEPTFKGSYTWVTSTELEITPAQGALAKGQLINYYLRDTLRDWYLNSDGEFSVASFALVHGQEGVYQLDPVESDSEDDNDSEGDSESGSQDRYEGKAGSRSQAIARALGLLNSQVMSNQIYDVVLGKPNAVGILTDELDSPVIAPSNGITLIFDQAVQPEDVLGQVQLENGKTLALEFSTTTYDKHNFGSLIPEDFLLMARVKGSIAPESNFSLQVWPRKQKDRVFTAQLEAAPALIWSIPSLENATEAQDLSCEFALEFSTTISLDKLRESLTVDSDNAAPAFYVYRSGDNYYLSLSRLQYGSEYFISLSENFTDIYGQSLPAPANSEEPQQYRFRTIDRKPELACPKEMLVLEEGQNRLPLKVLNPGEIDLEIYRYGSITDFIVALERYKANPDSSPDMSKLERPQRIHANLTSTPEESSNLNRRLQLELGMDTLVGLKLINVIMHGEGSEANEALGGQSLVQTTGIALSAKVWGRQIMVWALDMGERKGLAKRTASLYDSSGEQLQSLVLDGDGLGVFQLGDAQEAKYLAVVDGKDTALLAVDSRNLSDPWQFGMPGGQNQGLAALSMALFCERGAYRPGETVNFKGFLRREAGQDLGDISVEIKNPRGELVYEQLHSFDQWLGIDGSYQVPELAQTGQYTLKATINDQTRWTSFRVEEYRVPNFVVKVDSSAPLEMGQRASFLLDASYLRGGVLDGRQYTWRAYRQVEPYRNTRYPGYLFGLYPGAASTGNVATGYGVLNEQGQAKIGFKIDSAGFASSMRYFVEVSVTDVDRQVQAGRFTQVVNGQGYRIGLRPSFRNIFQENDVLRIPYIVLNQDGSPVHGQEVKIFLNRLEYHTTTQENQEGSTRINNRTVISQQQIGYQTSTVDPRNLALKIPAPGSWQLRLDVKDPKGIVASTEFVFSVYGAADSVWPRFDRERYELQADRTVYQVGDTIKVMPQSPYQQALGLLTVEAGGVLSRKIVQFNGGTPVFEVPVTADMAPNAFISLVLIRSRQHTMVDGTGFQTGAPGYKVGYTQVRIQPPASDLSLQVRDAPALASPGQEYSFTVQAALSNGQPSEASVCVMVVDEAVLRLSAYQTPDPVALAWVLRSLGVQNGSNILDMPHSRRNRNESLFPGGDGDVAGLIEAMEYQDRQDQVRALFKSTAYWDPALTLDAKGRAKVSFVLPDNLTSYRIMVVGANQKGAMGSAQASLVSQKPLMVQPILPRFVSQGDSLVVQAAIANGTSQALNLTINASFEGASLKAGTKAVQSLTIPAGQTQLVSYPIQVAQGQSGRPKASILTAQFEAKGGAYSDTVKTTIPIRSILIQESKNLTSFIYSAQSLSLAIPKDRVANSLWTDLSITSANLPLAGLEPAMSHLLQYPHGCIEQTSSRAYPLVVLADLMQSFGLDISPTEVSKMATAGIQRIHTFATSSGGLSYWPGSTEAHAYGSVYGLNILSEAKKRGFVVDAQIYGKLLEYVQILLRKPSVTSYSQGLSDNQKAYACLVLARAGQPQGMIIDALYQKQNNLSDYGFGLLLIAAKETPGSQALVEQMKPQLSARLASTNQEKSGRSYDSWAMDSPIRDAAVMLLAQFKAGISIADLKKGVEALLKAQNQQGWSNTQNNIFTLMAITEIFAKTPGTDPTTSSINLQGKDYWLKDMAPLKDGGRLLRVDNLDKVDDALNLRIGNESLFISWRASWQVEPTIARLQQVSAGYRLERRYENARGQALDAKKIPLGELVRVRLFVHADADKFYVALNDFLPAGLEPVNSALATSGDESQSALSDLAVANAALVSYREMRDYGISIYCNELKAGDYEFVYYARSTIAGNFFHPAATIEAMYEPQFRASTSAAHTKVE